MDDALGAAHLRRLHEMWRGAGWPCHDTIELDLLTAGLLQRQWGDQGHETLRVTDAGIARMAARRERNRRTRSAHEGLVGQVVLQAQRAGRLAWRSLSLRAPLVGEDGRTRWVSAMPDVFSIRPSTLEDGVLPAAYEVKVSRADLLSDLRSASKGQAYAALAAECWYVLREGIAHADEIPQLFGVMLARAQGLDVVRPAPRRPARMSLHVWMALARADAEAEPAEPAQAGLVGEHRPSPQTTKPAQREL